MLVEVPVEVAEYEVEAAIEVLLPPLVRRSDRLPARVADLLTAGRRQADEREEQPDDENSLEPHGADTHATSSRRRSSA